MAVQHKDIPKEHMHDPYRWVVADEAERLAIAPAVSDVLKWAHQLSDDTIWELKDSDPITWRQVSAVSSVHGRAGAVTAQTGDYTPAQVGADPAGTASNAVTSHEQAANPHDQYVQKVTGKSLSTNDYTDAEQTKLAGIEAGATQNATDAELRDRSTHTGTQPASTISNFDAQASAAAPVQTVDGQSGAVDLSGSYEQKRQNNLSATTDPTATDDASAGYEPLSRWINTSTGEIWLCVDATNGAANWQKASLTLDELGSAAIADVGTGSTQVPTNADLPTASETTKGMVEKATTAEAQAGTAGKFPDAAGVHAAFTRRGYFGSMSSAVLLQNEGGNATSVGLKNGRYIVQPSLDTGLPPGADNGTLEHVLVNAVQGGYGHQLYTSYISGRTYLRRINGGNFGAWQELFHTGNILGTVSQSGGVPTGAVIERGSNANGEYVKFADGTVQMLLQFSADVTAAGTDFEFSNTLPTSIIVSGSFSAATLQPVSTNSYEIRKMEARVPSSTSVLVRIKVDNAQEYVVRQFVTGRWY